MIKIKIGTILAIINGLVLSAVAINQGYGINDWQWWAWIVGGAIYLTTMNHVYNYFKQQT